MDFVWIVIPQLTIQPVDSLEVAVELHIRAVPTVAEKVVLSVCLVEVEDMGTGTEHVHVVLLAPSVVEDLENIEYKY
ncbi:hypothetical protein HUJ04_011722 [Dendroctonus ponderosae]|nr:hypothetical protein HUJ04_011722 [Dendroctonus ponderosae]